MGRRMAPILPIVSAADFGGSLRGRGPKRQETTKRRMSGRMLTDRDERLVLLFGLPANQRRGGSLL